MFRYSFLVATFFSLIGCSSFSDNKQITYTTQNTLSPLTTTLSHIRAYILIGNISKAEQLFQSVAPSIPSKSSMLLLAEIHAAKGESVESQQVFLTALANNQQESTNLAKVPDELLIYFCREKKWPALRGYAATLLNNKNANSNGKSNAVSDQIINSALAQIGLCFFDQERFEDASRYLQEVDGEQRVSAKVYLALARIAVDQKDYQTAQNYILEFERRKETIDAKILWTTVEVYLALNQPGKAKEVGENLRALFAFNEYSRKYILLTKRGILSADDTSNSSAVSPSPIQTQTQTQSKPTIEYNTIHTIQKGETLYRISKLYGLTTAELLSWNPGLVADDIPLGTPIKLIGKE